MENLSSAPSRRWFTLRKIDQLSTVGLAVALGWFVLTAAGAWGAVAACSLGFLGALGRAVVFSRRRKASGGTTGQQ